MAVGGVDCSKLTVLAVRELMWGQRGSSVSVTVSRQMRRDTDKISVTLKRGGRLHSSDGLWEWIHPSAPLTEFSHHSW